MKKYAIVLLILFAFVTSSIAQIAHQRYSIAYKKQHLLLQQNHKINVVDIDVEWPELLACDRVWKLKKQLLNVAFESSDSVFSSAFAKYVSDLGSPVTGTFKETPDDDKFSYFNVSIREVGLWPERFVTFLVHTNVVGGKKTQHQSSDSQKLVVYSLQENRLMNQKEIFHFDYLNKQIYDLSLPSAFMVDGTINKSIFGTYEMNLSQVGIGNKCYLFMGKQPYSANGNVKDAHLIVQVDDIKDFIPRKMRKSFDRSLLINIDTVCLQELPGVCPDVDQKAVFEFEDGNISKYIATRLELPKKFQLENPNRKVTASFVLDEKGMVSDISIVEPSSPMLDRKIVSTIAQMPRWKPAFKDGNVTKMRILVSLALKL